MSFKIEALRGLAETAYFRGYRYATGLRRSYQDFACDIMADTFCDEDPLVEHEPEKGEWLRRYFSVTHHRKTGRPYYTIPRSDRYQALLSFMAKKGLITAVTVEDHRQDIFKAKRQALLSAYETFADQGYLAGTFRGMLHGVAEYDHCALEFILLIHLLYGEPLFRARLVQAEYSLKGANSKHESRLLAFAYDRSSRIDAFAAFGVKEGRIFGGQSNGVMTATDFAYDKRGRRVLEMTLSGVHEDAGAVRLKLCRQPADIDRAIGLLKRFSADMARPIAAE